MNKYFVKTSDEATAEYLRKAGFEELPKEGNHWVFINSPDRFAEFSASDGLKMNFSNNLCV